MAIALSLREFLHRHGVNYKTLSHKHSDSSYNSAASAHIPSEQLAKAVILGNSDGRQLMAVLPANRKLMLSAINDLTCSDFELLPQQQLAKLFSDCETGVAPAMGSAYGLEMIVDSEMLGENGAYIEAGDHRTLLKIESDDYLKLMMNSRNGSISGDWLGDHPPPSESYPVFG